MIIKEITLKTNSLEAEKYFYSKTLGFDFLENKSDCFSVQIGKSKLIFEKSEQKHIYHYCFLIPRNQLKSAIKWLNQRLELLKNEEGEIINLLEDWNADSIYFYDGSGNIAEFIVRYDLKNEENIKFNQSSIISVNEIGLPTKDIESLNNQLENEIKTKFWKGNKIRFGTNGDQNGLFLLPNFEIKKTWFPTNQKIRPEPVKAIIENNNHEYFVEFENGNLIKRSLK